MQMTDLSVSTAKLFVVVNQFFFSSIRNVGDIPLLVRPLPLSSPCPLWYFPAKLLCRLRLQQQHVWINLCCGKFRFCLISFLRFELLPGFRCAQGAKQPYALWGCWLTIFNMTERYPLFFWWNFSSWWRWRSASLHCLRILDAKWRGE